MIEQLDGPLVVLGAPRSGTTLLRLMLTSHPEICIPPESRFMVEWFEQFGGSHEDKPDIDQLLGVLSRSNRFNEWELTTEEVRDRLLVEQPATRRDAMLSIHLLYSQKYQPEATIWGTKNPGYIFNVPFLRDCFPKSKFLLLLRDPRAILASFEKLVREKGGRWANTEVQLHRIRRFSAKVAELRRELRGRPEFHEIRYEDLVTDPGPMLITLCKWMGIDYNDQMLKYTEVRSTTNWVAPRMLDMSKLLLRQPSQERISSWQTELSQGSLQGLEILLGPLLNELGYQPASTAPRLRGWWRVGGEVFRNPAVFGAAIRHRLQR